ncbi:THAP domain-containing protein 2-like [Anoplopoma fimbria]|uniref:THAP domain-containing protein 2-like n=1 Tax=Anoplopoma fimbria TaxID=229290 RepID=UPI0023EE03B1|nr:THAP domain-containing protein 2-like [Anoplopoma fimbria]XP_054452241.1 THAP domain-containing protein 2-like [Anoplopoma fimbria]
MVTANFSAQKKMPVHCAAFGCVHRRSVHTRREGITFHRFPKAGDQRRKWEVALKRQGFAANDDTMLCSKHFKPEHFDRTGQTVRIRLGVVPSIFAFPAHLLKSTASTDRTTSNSRRAKESLPMDIPQYAPVEPAALPQSQLVDHTYALSSCPFALKEGYIKAKDNVSRLQREKMNTRKRELRAKSSLQDVLMELREKNLMTEELSQRVGLYADLPLHLFEKKASEYSKEQREFAITLHLHGPKAYRYLRSTLQLPLPHPRSFLEI